MVKAFNSFSVMNRTATFLSLFPNIELKHKAWVESLKATYEKLKWSHLSPYLSDNLGWFKAKWSDYLDYSEKHVHAHSDSPVWIFSAGVWQELNSSEAEL